MLWVLTEHDLFGKPVFHFSGSCSGRGAPYSAPIPYSQPRAALVARNAVTIVSDDGLASCQPFALARRGLRLFLLAERRRHGPDVGVAAGSPLPDAIDAPSAADAVQVADPAGVN